MPPLRRGRPETLAQGRVLVVEAHADTRDLLLTVLGSAGYDVSVAEDGSAAQHFRERPADVVLMDLSPSPGVAPAARQLGAEFPGAAIVAMSGDDGRQWSEATARARTAGAHLTVRKPLEPWLLLRSLEGLMAARRTLSGSRRRTA
jgi:CheY-like chemotaxis protein